MFASALCCFLGRSAAREPSPDPFSGIAAEQERSKRSLRILSRDPAPSSNLERLHELDDFSVSGLRAASRDAPRTISALTMTEPASGGSSRSPTTGDGPEWVDHAWDSLVKGRVLNDVASAPNLDDDDDISFRSLAVAMQSQTVVMPSDLDDYMEDSPRSGGPWDDDGDGSDPPSVSPILRSGLPDTPVRPIDDDSSSMMSMSRLQMLAEDPFLEDLSLENLSLNSPTPRSVYEDKFYSPPVTTTSARGSLPRATSPELGYHSGPPSSGSSVLAGGYFEDAPTPPYSASLDRADARFRAVSGRGSRGSAAGVPRSPGSSSSSSVPQSPSPAAAGRALRLEDILGRVEGLSRVGGDAREDRRSAIDEHPEDEDDVVGGGPTSSQAFEDDQAWGPVLSSHHPHAPLEEGIVDSSSGSESGTANMYSDAPADAIAVAQLRDSDESSDSSEEESAASSSSDESSSSEEDDAEDAKNSDVMPHEEALERPMDRRQFDADSVTEGSSTSRASTSRAAHDVPACCADAMGTEFSYITEDAKSSSGKSTSWSEAQMGSGPSSTAAVIEEERACGRDCELGFSLCAAHAAAEELVRERDVRGEKGERFGDMDKMGVERSKRTRKAFSMISAMKLAPRENTDKKVSRHLSMPLRPVAGKRCEEEVEECDEGPSVANLRRMWSERARQ